MIELKAYEKLSTHAVHLVGTFPSPRVEGHAQCGQSLEGMKLMTIPLSEVPHYSICRKCLQLLGIL